MEQKNTFFKIIVVIIILALAVAVGQYFLIGQSPSESDISSQESMMEEEAETSSATTASVTIKEEPEDIKMEENKTYTMDEIATHNSAEDCWLLIEGKVYDVTNFISLHPGGKTILEGCGTDATTLFFTRPMGSGTPHSESAQSNLPNFAIGSLAD